MNQRTLLKKKKNSYNQPSKFQQSILKQKKKKNFNNVESKAIAHPK